jgi:hypothetical protein
MFGYRQQYVPILIPVYNPFQIKDKVVNLHWHLKYRENLIELCQIFRYLYSCERHVQIRFCHDFTTHQGNTGNKVKTGHDFGYIYIYKKTR